MIPERLSRLGMMVGEDGIDKLRAARVAVFGIGGVGGFAVEALARSGIGTLDLTDSDTVAESNLNRQIIALHSTLGQYKADVMAERIHDISPDTAVNVHRCFFLPETAGEFDFTQYDYVIDAIDTVTGKIAIIEKAKAAGVPVISAMGAGNKLDPTALRVADISKTDTCPLARVMRYELRKRGIKGVKAVYSTELPAEHAAGEAAPSGRSVPASNAFVPSVMGLIIAGEVIKDLSGILPQK